MGDCYDKKEEYISFNTKLQDKDTTLLNEIPKIYTNILNDIRAKSSRTKSNLKKEQFVSLQPDLECIDRLLETLNIIRTAEPKLKAAAKAEAEAKAEAAAKAKAEAEAAKAAAEAAAKAKAEAEAAAEARRRAEAEAEARRRAEAAAEAEAEARRKAAEAEAAEAAARDADNVNTERIKNELNDKYKQLQDRIHTINKNYYVNLTDNIYQPSLKLTEFEVNQKTLPDFPKIKPVKLLENLNNNLLAYLTYLNETQGKVRVYVRFNPNGGGTTETTPRDDASGPGCLNVYEKSDFKTYFQGTFGGINNINDNNTLYNTLKAGSTEDNIDKLDIVNDILNENTDTVLITYGYSGTGKTYTLFGNVFTKKEGEAQVDGIVQKVITELTNKKVSVDIDQAFFLYKKDFNTPIESIPLNKDKYKYIYEEVIQGTKEDLLIGIDSYKSITDKIYDITNKVNEKYIFWTTNNAYSSRGHLIIVFKVTFNKYGITKTGYFTVIDFAGLEDIYFIHQNMTNFTNTTLEDFFINKDTYLNPSTGKTTYGPTFVNGKTINTSIPDFKKGLYNNNKELQDSVSKVAIPTKRAGLKNVETIQDPIKKAKYKRVKYLYDRLEEGMFINDSLKKIGWFLRPITTKFTDKDIQKIIIPSFNTTYMVQNPDTLNNKFTNGTIGDDGITNITQLSDIIFNTQHKNKAKNDYLNALNKFVNTYKIDETGQFVKSKDLTSETDIRNVLDDIRHKFKSTDEPIYESKVNKNTRFVMFFTFNTKMQPNCNNYISSFEFAKSISSKVVFGGGRRRGGGVRKRVSKKAVVEKRPKTKRPSKVRG